MQGPPAFEPPHSPIVCSCYAELGKKKKVRFSDLGKKKKERTPEQKAAAAAVREKKKAAKMAAEAEKEAKKTARREARRRNALESCQICEANLLRKAMKKSRKASLSRLPVECSLSGITDEQLEAWVLSLQLEKDRRLQKCLKG